MKKKPTGRRIRIIPRPRGSKRCLGCEACIPLARVICPHCHAYRFDPHTTSPIT